jgi:phenylacetate-CoA ligase
MMRMESSMPQIGDWSSIDELTELQQKQLPQIMKWAKRSPFYQARLGTGPYPTTLSEFSGLPSTSKQDLRDNYPFGMLAVPKARLATYHESSGTAGQPTPSYYTAEDWVDLAERYARKWVEIDQDDIFLVRTPYALMVTGHLAQAGARLRGATVVPGDNRSTAMPYSRVVRVLHRLGVTLSWSMPTETLMWAAAAKAAGLEPGRDFPALRALFIGGEPVSTSRRRRISEIWGVPVVEEYGATETGSLAGECPSGRLHLWADRAIFEVYNPLTGKATSTGAGQLVVTPLFREAMPLLRYNLGDDVEVSYDECDCGWHLPTVRVLGRSAFGYTVGDKKVAQFQLEELVFQLPAGFEVLFWRAKAHPSRLDVEIEVPDEHREDACSMLRRAIGAELGVECLVRGVSPGGLVSRDALVNIQDVVKPRGLFGPDEDWGKALVYY